MVKCRRIVEGSTANIRITNKYVITVVSMLLHTIPSCRCWRQRISSEHCWTPNPARTGKNTTYFRQQRNTEFPIMGFCRRAESVQVPKQIFCVCVLFGGTAAAIGGASHRRVAKCIEHCEHIIRECNIEYKHYDCCCVSLTRTHPPRACVNTFRWWLFWLFGFWLCVRHHRARGCQWRAHTRSQLHMLNRMTRVDREATKKAIVDKVNEKS